MPRTAPAPNIPAIPGMCPGIIVAAGGGGGGGSGAGGGKGKGGKKGAGTGNGEENATADSKSASKCGTGSTDGGGCPNDHGHGASGTITKGDPVDVVTGRVTVGPLTDLFLPGPLPLLITRGYSSFSRQNDVGFGWGWSSSLRWRLEVKRRQCLVLDASGVLHTFPTPDDGEASLGPQGWLLHKEDGTYLLDRQDGRRLCFAQSVSGEWWLVAIEDDHGNHIDIDYQRADSITVTDSVGRVLSLLTDRAGHVTSIVGVDESNGCQRVPFFSFEYDVNGCLVRATDGDGGATTYHYDSERRLTAYTDANGLTFYFTYDSQGRCTETWGQYSFDDPALSPSVGATLADSRFRAKGIYHTVIEFEEGGYSEATDSLTTHRYFGNENGTVDKAVSVGGVYERKFDENGSLIELIDAMGAITRWERDEFGRELSVTNALGNTTSIARSGDGEIDRVTYPDGSVTQVYRGESTLTIVDPKNSAMTIHYDERGQEVETRFDDGSFERLDRDAHGNVVTRTRRNGTREDARYDYWGRCVQVKHDTGVTTDYRHSIAGKLLEVGEYNGVTRYQYDGVGNLTTIVDPLGYVTRLEYGGVRKLCRVVMPNGRITQMKYNREGMLDCVINSKGEVHRYERNVWGWVTEERFFDGRVVRYEHDAMGRRTRVTDARGSTEIERDLLGRVVRRAYADGIEERFAYDVRGKMSSAEDSGCRIEFERDVLGDIIAEVQCVGADVVRVAREVDARGETRRLRSSLGYDLEWQQEREANESLLMMNGRAVARSSYDREGRELMRDLLGGSAIQRAFTWDGRLVSQRVSDSASNGTPGVSAEQSFGYDVNGLLADCTTDLAQARLRHVFEYDAIGQLAGVTDQTGTTRHHAYDHDGNRVDAEGARYYTGDRLVQDAGFDYVYDDCAQLCSTVDRRRGAKTEHVWNGRGQLAVTRTPDGQTVYYSYDPLGRRLVKRVTWNDEGGALRERMTRYVWDGHALLHETTTTTAEPDVTRRRTYVFEARRTVPMMHCDEEMRGDALATSTWWHYLNDDSGAPELLVAPDGRVVRVAKSAWGEVARGDAAVTTPFRFRGQYSDDETGLSYNLHRYYDPRAGRYISADPIGLIGGINAFVYANNCPTSAIDVEGLMYSVIKDGSGKVVAEGHNLAEGGGVGSPQFGRGSCAETTALHDLMAKKGIGKGDIAKLFNEEGYTIETYEGRKGSQRFAANPCPQCAAMFHDELGIKKGVMAHNQKPNETVKPWDGSSTYRPMSRGKLKDSRRNKR